MRGNTAELVRGILFKNRSDRVRDGNGRSSTVEKQGWSFVKSYICGDECTAVLGGEDSASVGQLEFSSVVAGENSAHMTTLCQFRSDFTGEDAASVRSTEATVTQPTVGEIPDKGITANISNSEKPREEKQNSTRKLFLQEDAAMTIQSAFRSYLARRSSQVQESENGKQGLLVETAIQSPESLGSSIKVQTGDSTRTSLADVESTNLRQPMHKKVRVQVAKSQEGWDDSTVSSTMSKMRIQNRREAATRRERALAYAFAQQLRVCSKKKHTKPNTLDNNMSWSWLERWMATRQQENFLIGNYMGKATELHICNDQSIFGNKLMRTTAEEESCGSNEISIKIAGNSGSRHRTNNNFRPAKSKGKAMKNISRQQFVQGSQHLKQPKVNKKDFHDEDERGNKGKSRQTDNMI